MAFNERASDPVWASRPTLQPRAAQGPTGPAGPGGPRRRGAFGSMSPRQFPRLSNVMHGAFGPSGTFERLAHAVNVTEELRMPGGWRGIAGFARGERAFTPPRTPEAGEMLGLQKRLELLQMRQFPGMRS